MSPPPSPIRGAEAPTRTKIKALIVKIASLPFPAELPLTQILKKSADLTFSSSVCVFRQKIAPGQISLCILLPETLRLRFPDVY